MWLKDVCLFLLISLWFGLLTMADADNKRAVDNDSQATLIVHADRICGKIQHEFRICCQFKGVVPDSVLQVPATGAMAAWCNSNGLRCNSNGPRCSTGTSTQSSRQCDPTNFWNFMRLSETLLNVFWTFQNPSETLLKTTEHFWNCLICFWLHSVTCIT